MSMTSNEPTLYGKPRPGHGGKYGAAASSGELKSALDVRYPMRAEMSAEALSAELDNVDVHNVVALTQLLTANLKNALVAIDEMRDAEISGLTSGTAYDNAMERAAKEVSDESLASGVRLSEARVKGHAALECTAYEMDVLVAKREKIVAKSNLDKAKLMLSTVGTVLATERDILKMTDYSYGNARNTLNAAEQAKKNSKKPSKKTPEGA